MLTAWQEGLVAIYQHVPADEVRRWWNCKDTDLLDEIVETAPAVRLGTIATAARDPEPASPARRVFELIFLRGTCPQDFTARMTDPYVLPLLDRELAAAILDAFNPRSGDREVLDVGDREQIEAFLDEHVAAPRDDVPRRIA
jgi:hypothetical protein